MPVQRSLSLLLWVLLCAPASALGEELVLGLFIGNNRYVGDSSRDLHYADDDALAAEELFRVLYPEGVAWVLAEPDADTRVRRGLDWDGGSSGQSNNSQLEPGASHHLKPDSRGFEEAIAALRAAVDQSRVEKNARVVLLTHFSGHGDKDGHLHLADQRLELTAFREALLSTGADKVYALMDACFVATGLARGDEEVALPPPDLFPDVMLEPRHRRDLLMVASTTAVPEDPYLERGLLSVIGWTCLLGVADRDHDAQVSFREWGRCIDAQIGDQEDGPRLAISRPATDPLAPVAVLPREAGGLELSPDFFEGVIRVSRVETREAVAEFYHHEDELVQLILPPGVFNVVRLVDRTTWRHPGYPAEMLSIEIARARISLPSPKHPIRKVVLTRGEETEFVPEGFVPVIISAEEETWIRNSPFRWDVDPSKWTLPSSWSFSVHYEPRGVELRYPTSSSEAAPPSVNRDPPPPEWGVKVGRIQPLWQRGRLFLLGGATAGYALQLFPEMWAGTEVRAAPAIRHELRVGPRWGALWSGPVLRIELETALEYAPGLVTSSYGLLSDLESPGSLWKEEERYVFLRNVVGEVSIGFRIPIHSSWELGPVLRGEVMRFQLPPGAVQGIEPVVSWESQLRTGTEITSHFWHTG